MMNIILAPPRKAISTSHLSHCDSDSRSHCYKNASICMYMPGVLSWISSIAVGREKIFVEE